MSAPIPARSWWERLSCARRPLNGAVTYMTGFLFRDVRIPNNAAIVAARLHVDPWGNQNGMPVSVDIRGEVQPQASDFGPTNQPLHFRPRTKPS